MLFVIVILVGFLKIFGAACSFSTSKLSGGTVSNAQEIKPVADTPYESQVWADTSSGGDFEVTLYGAGAAFKSSWNQTKNFLSRVGLKLDEGKTYAAYGDIKAEYAYDRIPYECIHNDSIAGDPCENGGVAGDYSYIGAYGWFIGEPLVEYLIVDDWFGNAWGDDTNSVSQYTVCAEGVTSCPKGPITVDGSVYEVYVNDMNSLTIKGTTGPYKQYFSVRANPRKCGTITVSEHFKEWEKLGLPLGTLYEVKLFVQTGGGIGWIDYTHGTVTTYPPEPSDGASTFSVVKAGLLLLAVFLLTFGLLK